MRRPRPAKTRKAVAKRFKITATGKVLRSHSGRRHLLQSKSPKRRRGLRSVAVLAPGDVDRIKLNMPFDR